MPALSHEASERLSTAPDAETVLFSPRWYWLVALVGGMISLAFAVIHNEQAVGEPNRVNPPRRLGAGHSAVRRALTLGLIAFYGSIFVAGAGVRPVWGWGLAPIIVLVAAAVSAERLHASIDTASTSPTSPAALSRWSALISFAVLNLGLVLIALLIARAVSLR